MQSNLKTLVDALFNAQQEKQEAKKVTQGKENLSKTYYHLGLLDGINIKKLIIKYQDFTANEESIFETLFEEYELDINEDVEKRIYETNSYYKELEIKNRNLLKQNPKIIKFLDDGETTDIKEDDLKILRQIIKNNDELSDIRNTCFFKTGIKEGALI